MRQYTDAEFSLTAKGIDLTAADAVYVTVSDKARAISVTNTTPTLAVVGSDTAVTFELTQEQTGKFVENTKADVEINYWINGKRKGTKIGRICVDENLLKEVIELD